MQMHCECGHKWCYVCVVDLGKDADINGETSHRIESTGCPMYLEELAGTLWHSVFVLLLSLRLLSLTCYCAIEQQKHTTDGQMAEIEEALILFLRNEHRRGALFNGAAKYV